MIPDTKDGQTNYCPNCEDQARRIEYLESYIEAQKESFDEVAQANIKFQAQVKEHERRERMLVDALKECKSDLFYQISSKHGNKAASKYPSIVQAKNSINATRYIYREKGGTTCYNEPRATDNEAIALVAIPELKEVK